MCFCIKADFFYLQEIVGSLTRSLVSPHKIDVAADVEKNVKLFFQCVFDAPTWVLNTLEEESSFMHNLNNIMRSIVTLSLTLITRINDLKGKIKAIKNTLTSAEGNLNEVNV